MFGEYYIRARLKGNFNDEQADAEIYLEAVSHPTNTVNTRTLNSPP
jgi:hypothetical protein